MLPACRCIATLPYGETARGQRPAPGPPGGRASRIETDIELWRACAPRNSAHVLHGETEGIGGAQCFGLGGGAAGDGRESIPVELRPQRGRVGGKARKAAPRARSSSSAAPFISAGAGRRRSVLRRWSRSGPGIGCSTSEAAAPAVGPGPRRRCEPSASPAARAPGSPPAPPSRGTTPGRRRFPRRERARVRRATPAQ